MMPAHDTLRATETAEDFHSTTEPENTAMTTTTRVDPKISPPASMHPAIPYVKAPPPFALPDVPAGIVTMPSAQLRGQLPRKQELDLLPGVVDEVTRFADFTGTFGKTAPSQAEVAQTLSSALLWLTLRLKLTLWDSYARVQEVAAWVNVRKLLSQLAPAFALATKTETAIGVENPLLGSLFGVRSAIAKRGHAVRLANEAEKDAGLPAYKGAAGKRRKKADAMAALEALEARTANRAAAAPLGGTAHDAEALARA